MPGGARVPAQGQHPDGEHGVRHDRADRDQRDRLLLPADQGRDLQWAERQRRRRLRSDPLRDHPPRQAVRHRRGRDRLRGSGGRQRQRPGPAGDGPHGLQLDVHARQHPAPRWQHALSLDLRQQRRRQHGAREVRRLLPAGRPRGDRRPGPRRAQRRGPDDRRLRRGGGCPRRLHPALSEGARRDADLHRLLLHDHRTARDAHPRLLVSPAGRIRLLRPGQPARAVAAASPTSRTSGALCSACCSSGSSPAAGRTTRRRRNIPCTERARRRERSPNDAIRLQA